MIRARFVTPPDDPRPVTWPPPGPYWVTGEQLCDGECVGIVVVAYGDSEDQLREFWPDVENMDVDDASEYLFTDRFPKPQWWDRVAKGAG